jgi:hypothetical protein
VGSSVNRQWSDGRTEILLSNFLTSVLGGASAPPFDGDKKMKIIAIILILLTSSLIGFAQNPTREVKIYLQRTLVDPSGSNSDESSPVKRTVNTNAPLKGALEMLFSESITEAEEKDGFWSPTYGMKFEGVVLKNGTATVKFSQPPDKTNYGSMGPMFFAEAIEKTGRQFPSVKRVKICAVGDTMIDSELDTPFDKCAMGGVK